ncbi:MAG: IS200/IS605 family transposase [Ktedonobacterales bacterium]
MSDEYIHEQHSVHHIFYPLIFCPMRRRTVLVGPVRDRLEQITQEVADDNGWEIVELAIEPDHLHLFVQSNPYTLPTDIPRLIKGRSSHLMREESPHRRRMPSLWTHSTFSSTADFVSQDTIPHILHTLRGSVEPDAHF